MSEVRIIRYDDGRWCEQQYVGDKLHGTWTVLACLDAIGTTVDATAQLLPLIECRPPVGSEAEQGGMDLQKQWVHAAIGLHGQGVGVLARVVGSPRPAPGEKVFFEGGDDLFRNFFADLTRVGHDGTSERGCSCRFFQEINTAEGETEGEDF